MRTRESRPYQGAAPERTGKSAPASLPLQETAPEYAARLVDLAHSRGRLPLYGSPEWERLDAADPRKIAAVAMAAEAWRKDGTDEAIRRRLQRELAEADLFTRYRVAEASRDIAAAVAELPYRPADLVPYAELKRRRNELLGVVL